MNTKKDLNISDIENYLYDKISGAVSKQTFINDTPNKEFIDDSWMDMCVIDIPTGIDDYYAYGSGSVLIWLYARPLDSGRKNVAVMKELERKLQEVIENSVSEKYHISRNMIYSDYDAGIKWHCNIVELSITVF